MTILMECSIHAHILFTDNDITLIICSSCNTSSYCSLNSGCNIELIHKLLFTLNYHHIFGKSSLLKARNKLVHLLFLNSWSNVVKLSVRHLEQRLWFHYTLTHLWCDGDRVHLLVNCRQEYRFYFCSPFLTILIKE